VELAGFVALRAQRQDPESAGHHRDDEHRADEQVRLLLGLDLHQPSAPSSELASEVSAEVDSAVAVGVATSSPSSGATGAASKAITRLNWAMKVRVRQSPPPPAPLPAASFLLASSEEL